MSTKGSSAYLSVRCWCRRELRELAKQGVLSEAELEECISTEFNPIRVSPPCD